MIRALLIYQSHSGLLAFESIYQPFHVKADFIPSFIFAMKHFFSEALHEDTRKDMAVQFGSYILYIVPIPDHYLDMIIVAERYDSYLIEKILAPLEAVVLDYVFLFKEPSTVVRSQDLASALLGVILPQENKVQKRNKTLIKTLPVQIADIRKAIQQKKGIDPERLSTPLINWYGELVPPFTDSNPYSCPPSRTMPKGVKIL